MSEAHTLLQLCGCLGSMVTIYGHRLFFFFNFCRWPRFESVEIFSFSFYFVLLVFIFFGSFVLFCFVLCFAFFPQEDLRVCLGLLWENMMTSDNFIHKSNVWVSCVSCIYYISDFETSFTNCS